VIQDLRETTLRSGHARFVFPRYDGFCFANIPNTVCELLGVEPVGRALDPLVAGAIPGDGFDHVLLVLIDGMGFDTFLEHAARLDLLRRVSERGSVASLTAVFPSTTAASLTSFATGLTPAEHGLPEWMVYFDELDEVITTLPFKRWHSRVRDELLAAGVDPTILLDRGTIFERLAAGGVASVCFSHQSYVQSAYSRVSRRGARSVGFLGLSDLVVRLADEIERATSPTFFYAYWDSFDTFEHAYGPASRETASELGSIEHAFTRLFREALGPAARGRAKRTLLLLTADHGQTPVACERTVYLTDREEVRRALRTRRSGEVIPPTGSIRDVMLHVKPGSLSSLEEHLADWLRGKAEILRTSEAFARGLFGSTSPSERLRRRVGDLLVLPYAGESVWGLYAGQERPHKMRGHHGGLTPREMFLPFGAARLGDVLEI